MIQNNVIHQSYEAGIKKLLFLGSSCIYPKLAKQPISESELLNGYLEPTNEPYAIAKIAGIKMCESYYRQYGCQFMSVMPANLYGPNDNFHLSAGLGLQRTSYISGSKTSIRLDCSEMSVCDSMSSNRWSSAVNSLKLL